MRALRSGARDGELLGAPQPGAAGAAIARDLGWGRRDDALGDQPQLGAMAAGADRRHGILDAIATLAREEALYDPVFAGVVADHRHAAPGSERSESAGERSPEDLELSVHGDAQRLEGPRRRVDAALV